MKIGMIIAIERELKAFLSLGGSVTEEGGGYRRVYRTQIAGHEICAMLSGCGLTDAAAATQYLITACGCGTVINFGVTGALDPSLRVDDLFVVRAAVNYGFDTSAIDPVRKHQYIEFPDEFIPTDRGLIDLVRAAYPEIREAVSASGDRFIEKREDKLTLRALGCDICDMEIAAIARVCYLNGARCLSVKCISDTFDGNGGDFIANVTASAEKAFGTILKILPLL